MLAYVDEAGFSQVHPNRSAWTPVGQSHLIEAKRGKRLNVLAAMLSTGGLISAEYWDTTTAPAFSGFLALMAEKIGKKTVVIIDNASIHRAATESHIIEYLEKVKGLSLYFLPPYSPEFNRLEKLWHKMKYCWVAPKCRDAKTLLQDVKEILTNFGGEYKICF